MSERAGEDNFRPRRADVRWRWDGEAGKHILVCMPYTGYVHILNPTAAMVFASADGSRTVAELTELVSRAYRVEPARVRGDIDKLLEMFLAAGLIGQPGVTSAPAADRSP
jgi:hypothetical protein